MAEDKPAVIVLDSDSSTEEMEIASLSEAAGGGQTSDIISIRTIEEAPTTTPLRSNTDATLGNHSLDVISVSSLEENIPSNRANITDEVIHKERNIEDNRATASEVLGSKFFDIDIRSHDIDILSHGIFYDSRRSQELHRNHPWIYQPVCPNERKSIHVLSLFDDITQELKGFGFLGKSMGNGNLKYLQDVTEIGRKDIEELGPFDFIFGSTPSVGYKHSSAKFFYEFYRILQYGRPPTTFWMFIDNLVLDEEIRDTASRFLEMEGVLILRYNNRDGNIQNAVHMWSNIPSVNSKYAASSVNTDLFLLAKNIFRRRIFTQRPATVIKKFLVPLKDYFRAFP